MKKLKTGDNWVNEISEEEEEKEVLFWVLVTFLLYLRTSPHDSISARAH